VNLAAEVVDGQQIVVPKVGAVVPGAAGSGAAAGATGAAAGGTAGAGAGAAGAGGAKPSLAVVTIEQLDQLDGIGPTLAQRIVEYRDSHGGFRSLEELGEVEGIGEKRLASLREALDP
jgi:competence protein ComEA